MTPQDEAWDAIEKFGSTYPTMSEICKRCGASFAAHYNFDCPDQEHGRITNDEFDGGLP